MRPFPLTSKPTTSTRLIEPFSERDLVADFKLDLDTGPRPRFLMTTGSLGPYNAGWAPLYVFETNTSQVAVYRMQVQLTIGKTSRPRFELVELRSYAKTSRRSLRPSVRVSQAAPSRRVCVSRGDSARRSAASAAGRPPAASPPPDRALRPAGGPARLRRRRPSPRRLR